MADTERTDSRRRIRRRWSAVAVVAVVVIAGLGIAGWGVLAGWFDQGSILGNTSGFVTTAPPPSSPTSTSWPTFGNTPESTRSNTALNSTLPLTPRWTVNVGSLVELPPVIGDGRVLAGTNHGLAIALDLRTGAVLWRHELGGAVAASPALTGIPGTPSAGQPRLALFATIPGDLIALDPATGAERWHLSLGTSIETSPLVLGDGVYIGTRAGTTLRVSLTTHRPVWTVAMGGSVKGAIAKSGTNVIVGDYSGHVTALSQTSGRVVWRATSPGKAFAGPGRFYGGAAVAYGRVYIGNVNGRVLGLNATTGAINWVHVVGDYVYSSAAVANRLVFEGSYDRHLYALDAVTGAVVWTRDLGQRISGSPSVIGNLVWVATLGRPVSAGHVFALDVRTGHQELVEATGRYAAAVGVDGTIVSTGVDTITALTPSRAR
jgi:outer membrane protein assembly factor BamB